MFDYPQLAMEMFKRARCVPLIVEADCTQTHRFDGLEISVYEEAALLQELPLAVESALRSGVIKYVHLTATYDETQRLVRFLAKSNLTLERLHLTSTNNYLGFFLYDVPPLPQLRHLSLRYCLPPSSSGWFSNLHTLKLEMHAYGGPRDPATILSILRRAPALERLKLVNTDMHRAGATRQAAITSYSTQDAAQLQDLTALSGYTVICIIS